MEVFKCIEGHTCGSPVRLIVEGGPALNGDTMTEKRLHFLEEFDWIRSGLMSEPRGSSNMNGSILYPAHDPENDVGVLFIDSSGCKTMSTNALIATITLAIEQEIIQPKFEGFLNVETPAGLIETTYEMDNAKVSWVKIINTPSFLYMQDIKVISPHLGEITLDIAYGGHFYAIIDTQENVKDMADYSADELKVFSKALKDIINKNIKLAHPKNKNACTLNHIMWTGKPSQEGSTAKNLVFYGEGRLERSPSGAGTAARMAQWAAKGKLKQGDLFIHESILNSNFTGLIEEPTQVGSFEAIIPSIKGWAKTTGFNTIIIDPEDDPYSLGFNL